MPPVAKPPRKRGRHFIKEWREFLHLTQDDAAELIGVTQSKLSRVESGRTPYDQDFLEEAARAYGTSPANLIACNPLVPDSAWSIDLQLLKASDKQRKQITDFVRFTMQQEEVNPD